MMPATTQLRDISSRKAAVVLCLILLFGAWLRIHHYRGFDHSDEMSYLQAASDLVSGDYRLPEPGYGGHAWLRFAIVLPLAAMIAVFGPDDRACAAPFYAVSLAAVVIIYYLGRDLCRSRSAGLMAAVMLAVNGQAVSCATRIYPDALQSLFIAVCVWMVVRSRLGALTAEPAGERPVRSRRIACGLLGGAAFACAVNTNIISLLFLPALAVILLLTFNLRAALKQALLLIAGFALIYVPLMICYWVVGGTPLLELAAIGRTNAMRGEETSISRILAARLASGMARLWAGMWNGGSYEILRILASHESFLAVGRPALLGLVFGLVYRRVDAEDRSAWRTAVWWFVMLYVVCEFGGAFLPLQKVPRYQHMFICPMIMIFVATIRPLLVGRWLPAALTAGSVAGLGYYLSGGISSRLGAPTDCQVELMHGIALLACFLLLGLFYSGRRLRILQVLAFTLLTFTLYVSCHRLGTGVSLQTELGRAMRKLDLPSPIYTNCWRTRMLLQSLYLHDRGKDGVITLCQPDEVMDAVEAGHAVVMYARPNSRFGYCVLSPEDSEKLLPSIEAKCDSLFDNRLYRVFRLMAPPTTDPAAAP